ncbi:alpha/beta family hydrolase [Idiomarina sp. HP20-50]|uniref:alpha/beta family hydrolase n=1 Tax=Idiomarina sp. HP20-50 TaxID=3070813 RepID=UPI00294A9B8B|nr:alpha/beta family hydrolase [Idiomarina sp. HP20-50]MDV6315399.1 dienelactone hydrolase family protein [Idiomarina sp. HP20-50]
MNYQRQNPEGAFRIVFLHGSGGGPDTEFMNFFAEQSMAFGAEVVRPDFPYWEKVRETGKPRPPNKMPVLVEAVDELLAELQRDNKTLILMGKSLGSRVMLRLADKYSVKAVIALGFPFHPPQKPEKSRLEELQLTQATGLILQGTRDPFSKPFLKRAEQGQRVELPDNWQLQWLEGADHGFTATKAKAANTPKLWQQAVDAIKEFIQ